MHVMITLRRSSPPRTRSSLAVQSWGCHPLLPPKSVYGFSAMDIDMIDVWEMDGDAATSSGIGSYSAARTHFSLP